MTLTAPSLLAELDTALTQATETWRSNTLRQITDLFLSGAESYSRDQVAVFAEVMSRLMQGADGAWLAELSVRLAPVGNAPVKVIASLARHPDIAVCGPVLEQAEALPDSDLVEIADRDRIEPDVLTKIAARPQLAASVTDILLKRGSAAVQRTVVDNPEAQVSEAGFARLIMSLNGDKGLAAAIAARDDVPAELRLWLAKILN